MQSFYNFCDAGNNSWNKSNSCVIWCKNLGDNGIYDLGTTQKNIQELRSENQVDIILNK